MTTSISSKALLLFVAWPTDRRTKYLQTRCSYTREMCTQKIRALSYIGAEKITFPPKPDRKTYRRTDISVYRIASLLKRFLPQNNPWMDALGTTGKTFHGLTKLWTKKVNKNFQGNPFFCLIQWLGNLHKYMYVSFFCGGEGDAKLLYTSKLFFILFVSNVNML